VWFLSEISNARLVMEQELEQGSEVHTAQPVISRRNRLFRYHAATTGVILLVAVILHSKHAGEVDQDARVHGCGTLPPFLVSQ
jgi:hypothetical protein